MTKYNNSYEIKPEINQVIYFIGPTGVELLGTFLGGTRFDAIGHENSKGFCAKFWRPAEEEIITSLKKEESPIYIKNKRRKHVTTI